MLPSAVARRDWCSVAQCHFYGCRGDRRGRCCRPSPRDKLFCACHCSATLRRRVPARDYDSDTIRRQRSITA